MQQRKQRKTQSDFSLAVDSVDTAAAAAECLAESIPAVLVVAVVVDDAGFVVAAVDFDSAVEEWTQSSAYCSYMCY